MSNLLENEVDNSHALYYDDEKMEKRAALLRATSAFRYKANSFKKSAGTVVYTCTADVDELVTFDRILMSVMVCTDLGGRFQTMLSRVKMQSVIVSVPAKRSGELTTESIVWDGEKGDVHIPARWNCLTQDEKVHPRGVMVFKPPPKNLWANWNGLSYWFPCAEADPLGKACGCYPNAHIYVPYLDRDGSVRHKVYDSSPDKSMFAMRIRAPQGSKLIFHYRSCLNNDCKPFAILEGYRAFGKGPIRQMELSKHIVPGDPPFPEIPMGGFSRCHKKEVAVEDEDEVKQ